MPSGWGNPLEMAPAQSNAAAPGLKKKIKRRRNLQRQASKKGDFEKRMSKLGDAPNLMSVVTAKSSIKQRAVKEAAERDQKNAKKKLAGRTKIVKKHPIKQRDNQWTTLSGKKVGSVSKKIATKKPKRRPSGDSKSSFASSRASSSWTKPLSSSSPTSDSGKSASASTAKKKKKKVKAKVIPSFASQHSGDLASLAEKRSKDADQRSVDKSITLDRSAHSIKSHGSLQNQKQQILLEFDMPDQQGSGLQLSVDLETVGDMSSIESWPSIQSDDTPETKMNKMMQRWMDLNIEFDDDDDGNKEVEAAAAAAAEEEEESSLLEDNCLDHIILASPKMKDALDTFEKLTGVRPVVMGPLEGLGIQTARVPMDGGRFIEIIAPDDIHPGPLSDELKTLPRGRVIPYQYAIRATEISRLIEGYVYDVLGWDPDHICMVQTLPDQKTRRWDLLTMYGHNIGGAAPIYVKYPGEHPTTKLGEPQITFKSFFVQADRDHRVHKLITDVGGIEIEYGQVPALEFEFDTPKGGRMLSNNYPAGLVFPGFKAAGAGKKAKSSSSRSSVKKKKSSKKKKEKS